MKIILLKPTLLKVIFFAFTSMLFSCGSESDNTSAAIAPSPDIAINTISHASFRDQDGGLAKIGGSISISTQNINNESTASVNSVWVYWANEHKEIIDEVWLKSTGEYNDNINIPLGTTLPINASGLLLFPANSNGLATTGTYIPFHDFISNTTLSGLGGNEQKSWEYGETRPAIAIQKTDQQGGLCIFDNGLVSVIDMNNTKDQHWINNSSQFNVVNDSEFPAYTFICSDQPVHNADKIEDEIGVWTYSTLNDAMFYGTIVYDNFVKYLGEPPLKEQIRLRVHYANMNDNYAYWDGAYANFSDAYPYFYSTASLDIIAHEVAHGVLNRFLNLTNFENALTTDVRTLHEAFGDISGVVAKYEFIGPNHSWNHGEETVTDIRQLNKIQTEQQAIASFLDYDSAGDNFYLRIGMITYPFYLLSEKWGIESAYHIYIQAAKNCWTINTTLTEAASCIKQQAAQVGLPEKEVVDAFKAVKIKLFDEGILSHFNVEQFKLRTHFTDNSQSTNQVDHWYWDFGDGSTSTEVNPEHTYASPGTYQVTLTVSDQTEDPNYNNDIFMRTLTVAEHYCPINSLDTSHQITDVVIAGNDLDYQANSSDYTSKIVNLAQANAALIAIQGNTDSTPTPTHWKIWIDVNDNGVFGDQPEELVLNQTVAENKPYALETTLDLSSLNNDGQPKFMRISGDYSVITTPCASNLGEALDVRVTW